MLRNPIRFYLYGCPLLALLLLVCLPSVVAADEQHIIADVKAFVETQNVTRQAELVRRIKAEPAYRRAKVGEYLHRAPLFDDLEPGFLGGFFPGLLVLSGAGARDPSQRTIGASRMPR